MAEVVEELKLDDVKFDNYISENGSPVILVELELFREGAANETVQGKIHAAFENKFLFIKTGTKGGQLILRHEVVRFSVLKAPAQFRSKFTPWPSEGRIRQHLLDRHGFAVEWANTHSEEQAEETHRLIHADQEFGGSHHHDRRADDKEKDTE